MPYFQELDFSILINATDGKRKTYRIVPVKIYNLPRTCLLAQQQAIKDGTEMPSGTYKIEPKPDEPEFVLDVFC